MKINILKNHLKKGFLIVKLRFVFLPTAFIVYWILVHCRVGSLEKKKPPKCLLVMVHCRVGSLEKWTTIYCSRHPVHCRVGSLEKIEESATRIHLVHCRVGSLEIAFY